MALKMHGSLAMHPGEWLKSEMIEPHGIQIVDLAAAFAVSRQALGAIFNGRARLTAEMATRFEMALGMKADMLMRMQVTHDMAQGRRHEGRMHIKRLVAA